MKDDWRAQQSREADEAKGLLYRPQDEIRAQLPMHYHGKKELALLLNPSEARGTQNLRQFSLAEAQVIMATTTSKLLSGRLRSR